MIYVFGILLVAIIVFFIWLIWPSRDDEHSSSLESSKHIEEEKRRRRQQMVESQMFLTHGMRNLLGQDMEVSALTADRITELRLEALETGKPIDPVALIEEALGLIPNGTLYARGSYIPSASLYSNGDYSYHPTTGTTEARALIELALKRLKADAPTAE